MTVTKTLLAVIEVTCDHCGKSESRSAIEGISAKGEMLFPDWPVFFLSIGMGSLGAAMNACGEACFNAICQKAYMAWEAHQPK